MNELQQATSSTYKYLQIYFEYKNNVMILIYILFEVSKAVPWIQLIDLINTHVVLFVLCVIIPITFYWLYILDENTIIVHFPH